MFSKLNVNIMADENGEYFIYFFLKSVDTI